MLIAIVLVFYLASITYLACNRAHKLLVHCSGKLSLLIAGERRLLCRSHVAGCHKWLSQEVEKKGIIEIHAFVSHIISPYAGHRIDLTVTGEEGYVKGLYAKARRGEIDGFTGIVHPYEISSKPELVLDSVAYTPDENARKLIEYFEDRGCLLNQRNHNYSHEDP